MTFTMGLNKWIGFPPPHFPFAFGCLSYSLKLKDRQGIDCRVLLPSEVVLFCPVLVFADPGDGDKEWKRGRQKWKLVATKKKSRRS